MLPHPVSQTRIIFPSAGNIAFLIKYTCGPAIQASQVSVSVINVRGLDNNEIGDKATICVHEGPGKFTVVISKQVESGQNAVIGLREKVNKAIEDILANEGNKGYGDI